MKANEAPEKLYVNFHFIETHPESHQPLVTKQGINKYDIEYTRTDAFIEKALAYLNSKFYFHNAFYAVVSTDFSAMEELFENFRKYMEGE